jgi:uncharacterized protein DUF5671
MTTIRRLYAYLLTLAGLAMLALGSANLGQIMLDVLFHTSAASDPAYVRDSVSRDVAAALVGLPVWLLHFWWTERAVRTDEAERASTLRRLFIYAVLAGSVIVIARSFNDALSELVVGRVSGAARELPFLLIGLVVWFAHWRLAQRDRALVGEVAGSATLRRWYVYGAAFVGWLVLLGATSDLLETLWQIASAQFVGDVPTLATAIAGSLTGALLWSLHWTLLPRLLDDPARQDDRRSALRTVYLFLALSVGVVGYVFGVSQLLFYAVARLLGVDEPGGIGGNLFQAAAGPTSTAIIFGAGWAYQRYALRIQAHAVAEVPRQAGIRRLYTYTVALIGLAVLGVGLAGLLWNLGDIILAAPAVLVGTAWRSNVALYATQALVGLPVWVLHWRARATEADEVHSLARRLYIYLSLIGSMLSLVGGLAFVLYRLIGLLLGTGSSVDVLIDCAHAAAVALVAAGIAAYHFRVLRLEPQRVSVATTARSDSAQPTASAAEPVEMLVHIRAANAATFEHALAVLRSSGVEVAVVGS